MYVVARRTASIATSKQSVAVAAASTASGASAFRPCTACSRSDCSALVGMPVDGPARWESTTTSGSSVAIARPSISVLSAKPGPEVDVTPSAPAYAAPIAAPIAAISSSAWKVITPYRVRPARVCSSTEAGVMGYPAKIMRSSPVARSPASSPHASASVPLTVRYTPGATGARRTV